MKSRTARELSALGAKVTAPDLLSGLFRTYQPRDEDGDMLPPESKRVQVIAEDVLSDVAITLSRLFDVTATKDAVNQHARADVVVKGDTLLANVPVTYLLFLQKRLAELHTFVSRIPTQDPAESWSFDPNTGVYVTSVVKTVRNKKVLRTTIVVPATDHHPAQAQAWHEDVPAGDWSAVKQSGALSERRRRETLVRIAELIDAVKTAQWAANGIEVVDIPVGRKVFDYILAE